VIWLSYFSEGVTWLIIGSLNRPDEITLFASLCFKQSGL